MALEVGIQNWFGQGAARRHIDPVFHDGNGDGCGSRCCAVAVTLLQAQ